MSAELRVAGLLLAALVQPAQGATCEPSPHAEPRRRSPSVPVLRYAEPECDPARLTTVPAGASGRLAGLPDRWRLVELLGVRENLLDPYSGYNWLKGDRPVYGEDWFVAVAATSDTLLEPRRFPVPVGISVTARPGSLDTYGDGTQWLVGQTLILEAVVYQGNTVFKPPDWEFRFTPAFNLSYLEVQERGLVKANPDAGRYRAEAALGIQALFVDKHLRNVSDRYDFDSVRIGVQPFTSDFRGFLFNDSAFGARLFGTRANNRLQYNLAWLRRIDKDTNSGLNDLVEGGLGALRDDDVFVANAYWQDWPVPGFFVQGSVIYNRNREGESQRYDDNGVLQRPASFGLERAGDYDVVYLGASGDGHFGRYNLTTSVYLAVGETDRGAFVERSQAVRAGFAAAEISRDYSWARVRGSFAYASADHQPFDGRATGFDAIFENPLFAGADASFWIRQAVPLVGGGRVTLSGRNGLLNSLRSSKEFGQSNFNNPGLVLAGLGADFDLTPALRVSTNLNGLAFADTSILEVARAQAGIDRAIGLDISLALTWRPLVSQNIVARVSAAALLPGGGYRDLYGSGAAWSAVGNLVLSY